ncbi:MAG TPA: thioredoxin domain-containing protein [Anaeromyxobacteraceae bacterium]|nr:thioredoxin domain-containing protein [Anaeromyxobacteraceae bacterium]
MSPLPGAPPFPSDLAARVAEAAAAPAPARARTHHLDESDRPRFTNRLVLESSPYLLQHAHNPVDWRPWGDAAFEEARARGVPVFLSIGYSTCHWCHVMERESFEDVEIARFLNERFVPVKVDREERPDVDSIYMTAVQALTGGGGWPMSAFLDDERRPFFAGTYFPARAGDRGAPRGFEDVLHEIDAVWRGDRDRVGRAAASLTEAVRVALGSGAGVPEGNGPIGTDELSRAVSLFAQAYDDRYGGVRGAPKFPSSMPVRLMLRWHRRTLDQRALDIATVTLERMAAGGLMDQLGGGFHRYSTDERWLVPHFEKMLYDNALLAVAYAEAWQVTKRRDFARVARQTLDYLLREMTAAEGAFFSATDADSEGEEGKFFVWTEREIRRALGDGAERFIGFYGVTPGGNFEGANVLHVPRPDEDEWEALGPARAALYEVREQRPRPLRDDKVLAAWNGLAIGAAAFVGRVLDEPHYVEAARRAARFVLERMRPHGRLQRTWRDGRAAVPAFLEDHAFLAQGLLELYEATFDVPWLVEAVSLCEEVERRFADRAGGWFSTADDHEELIARQRPTHDGAEPSGASIATLNALRLAAFTGQDRWRRIAARALAQYAPTLREHPAALGEMLLAVDFATDVPREVILVWRDGEAPPDDFVRPLRSTFLPNRALAAAAEGAQLEALAEVAPVAEGRIAVGGKPTAYVCERGQCQLPAISADKLQENLKPVRRIAPRG